ncbi:MAG: ImmA/IrrE family metallo-endopeptidase [Sphaerochaetaceae bacterium]|jgi:Zn-dependent peptidase ImmA (M78 family)|nr:ImmA/IrrE family metallo-endopeptidase [Sphaerochaetaceae bacterium]MDD3164127.1 ImmA/IrrE family metallo-endopeptidase [Sphaerochaetaceae bacterium]
MINYAKLMTMAALLRKQLGEDSSSPVDIIALAQRIDGLTIVYYPLGDNLSGMCIKSQNGNNVIAINSAMTLGRQRFSMAHEFYHLYYDDSMISVCAKKIDSGKEIERGADMFASYFLMPDAALVMLADELKEKNADHRLTLNEMIRIEQYFGVSHQAAVYRLLHTPYLNDEEANNLLNLSVRSTAESLGYSSDLYCPSAEAKRYKTYGNYISQAEQLFSRGLISSGKHEELMLDAFRSDLVYGDDDEGGDVID